MKNLTSIVAMNPQGAIGANNRLPWRVRSDLRFFRDQTIDQVVIMGRRTFDSLDQRGLPDRKNVVVTHGFGLMSMPSNCRPANGIAEALACADGWANQRQNVFIVGGASIYEQFAPFVSRYLITLVQKNVPDADTFFDEKWLASQGDWKMRSRFSGKADGLHDEADFEVFEFTREQPHDATEARRIIINKFKDRRDGNGLATDWTFKKAS